MIEVLAKIWRPKVVSWYRIPEYYGEDIDSILDYGQYGNCLYRTNLSWDEGVNRDNIIIFDDKLHSTELMKHLKFGENVDLHTRGVITSIIEKYWDCFVKEGTKRTILG